MAYRSSAVASVTVEGDITATPAGVAAGDYLGAGFACDDDTLLSFTMPSGWVNVLEQDQLGLDQQTLIIARKLVAAGGDSFTFNYSSDGAASNASLVAFAHTGRSGDRTPIGTSDATGGATPLAVSITGITAGAGDDIVVVMTQDQSSAAARWSWAEITGYTERQDEHSVDWIGIALDTRDNVSAGPTGSLATTLTRDSGTGTSAWIAAVLAIKTGTPSVILMGAICL